MPSSNIAQGSLNRLRGSISFPNLPALNITAPFLGPEGINISFEGPIVEMYETLTGTVTSPAPFQMFVAEVELLKTQSFSDQFKQQLETDATVGPFVVRVDTPTLSNYQVLNGAITAASPGRINGKSASFVVSLRGYYQVNSSLYDAA